ncbi:sulfatase-like hydrolase/transferase [Parapedobacter sp. 10938]|uniref:sulfatase-like hydrolase/transferase n=1 Tax=Parapedobacter flavus TaxID=3110225 RepID=UPI002DBA0397|nr:sulfatase-like hydrolase/transferase [Parapedobacter sp. 10938]MEC3880118.1 sulfatase-like hydrolase/transferase [Parapedobacter sp. 10938]
MKELPMMQKHVNKRMTGTIAVAAALLAASCGASAYRQSSTPAANPTNDQYNVIYILADDLGYSELGCYGNTFNETPHLDRLAAEGVRLTSAYAAAPVCSPYRAALMTGQYPARLQITDYLRPDADQHLDTAHTTLAEMFQQNGYHTGIVGKWHLSGYVKAGAEVETLPDKHGFDEVLVSENRGIAEGWYFHPYGFNHEIEKKLPGREYITDRQHEEALGFIERNKDQPFFLYLSHYAVHTTVHGQPEVVDRFRGKAAAGTSAPTRGNPENDPYKRWPADSRATHHNPHLAAQLYVIDQGVGMIREKLRELGIDKNTIIVFTSDNGGETTITTNAPLREGKSTLYEGGVREPFIIWNPTLFDPAVVHTPMATYDVYPTLMDLIDAKPNRQPFDGVSIAQTLRHPKQVPPERSFYWHYPLDKPHFLGGRSAGSIRKGDWKLIEFFDDSTTVLYNLRDDLGEQRDLAAQHPATAADLAAELQRWRQDVGAVPAKATFRNPVGNGADPWVTQYGGFYYTCESRQAKGKPGIAIRKSDKLTERGKPVQVWSAPDTGWNRSHIWAPELHRLGDKWYIYYAAGRSGPPYTQQRSGVLESVTSDPQGPYIDKGLLQTGTDPTDPAGTIWAIDVSVAEIGGTLYAVWSGWETNAPTDKTSQHLYMAEMANPWTLKGERVKISSPDQPWEQGGPLDLNEGPQFLQHNGQVFIIYSTRESWLPEYRLGQLRLTDPAASPLDPANWQKRGPVFQATPQVLGPGHASFTTSPDGTEWWIVYHAKKAAKPGWGRDIRMQPFSWAPDGNPRFGRPIPAGTRIAVPSGE